MRKTQLKSYDQYPKTLLCRACLSIPYKPKQCSIYCEVIYCARCAVQYQIQNKICKKCNQQIQTYPIQGITLFLYSTFEMLCKNCNIYHSALNYSKHSIKCLNQKAICLFQWKEYYFHIQTLNNRYLQEIELFLQQSQFTEDQVIQFQDLQIRCKCNQQFNLSYIKNHFYECGSAIVTCDQCNWEGNRNHFKNHIYICIQEQIKYNFQEEKLLSIAVNQLDMKLLQLKVEDKYLKEKEQNLSLSTLFFLRSGSNTYYEGQMI